MEQNYQTGYAKAIEIWYLTMQMKQNCPTGYTKRYQKIGCPSTMLENSTVLL
jgi:hypothetical protein